MSLSSDPFQKVVVLSTIHIPLEDNNTLLTLAAEEQFRTPSGVMVAAYHGGFMIRVFEDENRRTLKKHGLSDALCDLVEKARREKVEWLRLDCDGPEMSDLPTFEW